MTNRWFLLALTVLVACSHDEEPIVDTGLDATPANDLQEFGNGLDASDISDANFQCRTVYLPDTTGTEVTITVDPPKAISCHDACCDRGLVCVDLGPFVPTGYAEYESGISEFPLCDEIMPEFIPRYGNLILLTCYCDVNPQ